LAIGREIALTSFLPDHNDLALDNSRQGYIEAIEMTTLIVVSATFHIPKVLPIRVEQVDEVRNLKYVLRLMRFSHICI
jgi:hypothetical protein